MNIAASAQSKVMARTSLGGGRRRHLDKHSGMMIVHVLQGDCYTTADKNETLTTVLGSCIAACIRDPYVGFGGMNHFLLPQSDMAFESPMDASLRYGSFAMEQLINDILSHGGQRNRLEVKLFGGGNVVKELSGVGHRNADFIETYMENEGFEVASSDLRGFSPRKIQYTPATGKVLLRRLGEDQGATIARQEVRHNVQSPPVQSTGDVELFD